jgi:hypothetical protein
VAKAQIPIAPAATAAPPPASPPAAPDASAAPGATPAAESEPKAPPGDQYFVEQPPAAPPGPPPPFEPPPPGSAVSYEPPPPPQIRHRAPQSALWLGARLGWFIPFGNVWARAEPVSTSGGPAYVLRGVPWSDYASSGPMFELDVGMRLSRAYTVFGLWERAQLGSGSLDTGVDGEQDGAETDFWAIGLRASSNPDHVGFLTEVAVGYRRARTFFENDVEYQFTDAPFEARLGLGAEWRLSPLASMSALLTIGVGGFGSADRVGPNGTALALTRSLDEGDGHAWATISVGGHFDLIRSSK